MLRSAAALLAAGRIRRLMIEVVPSRWARFGVGVADGMAEIRSLLAGWVCIVACNGAPITWALADANYTKGVCRMTRSVQAVGYPVPEDIYCVLSSKPP